MSTNNYNMPSFTMNLIISILNLMLCTPLGLAALLFLLSANEWYVRGSTNAAYSKLRISKTLNTIGLVLGVMYFLCMCCFYSADIFATLANI